MAVDAGHSGGAGRAWNLEIMSDKNGKQKPFSHKDHAIALQGQVNELQKQCQALLEAGQAVDTKRALYASIVAALVHNMSYPDGRFMITPDDFDFAFEYCNCRFTTEWEDTDDGMRDCIVTLVENSPEDKKKNREETSKRRAEIAAKEPLPKLRLLDEDGGEL